MHEEISTDVLVVGAGAIGASTAYHLASRGVRVVVAEAFGGPAQGSTGRSFASVRAQWADDLNIELSWRSIQAFRDFPAQHGIEVGYRPSGYLFLVPEQAWDAQLAAVELQRAHGVPVTVLGLAGASHITPFASAGLGGATWGPADGVVDPHLATGAYLELARRAGARTLFGHRVSAIDASSADARQATAWQVTAGQRRITATHLVNAAGGWAGELAALAGLDVPVVHSRRNIYSSAPQALTAPVPMTVDVGTGVYVRTDGSRLLFGAARLDQPDGYDTSVDWPWMESVLERAEQRFPWLAELPLDRTGCWAGTYENTPDYHGILGADPSAPGWVNACGFSGHGLMQAPEIGRLAAEQIVDGRIASLDTTVLALDRFATSAAGSQVELVF